MNSSRFSVPVLFLLFTLCTYSQTQLLTTGSAASDFKDIGIDGLITLTLNKITINEKEYFLLKHSAPWLNPPYSNTSYARIEGDSCYYIYNQFTGKDSLVFNFNHTAGMTVRSDTTDNSVEEERIDSIIVETIFTPQDTIYYLSHYVFNTSTGDTVYSIPEVQRYSRKWGRIDYGINGYMQGVKYDGVRYGTVPPYPEEIYFSPDTLYRPGVLDTISFRLINTSDYGIVIDTVYALYEYSYTMDFINQYDSLRFYIYFGYSTQMTFPLPPHDSILVNNTYMELGHGKMDIFFTDSIFHAMHFTGTGQQFSYNFNKQISVSGYSTIYGSSGDDEIIPGKMSLSQNYPNPFNPETEIKFEINKTSEVKLIIFDLLGREITVLVNEELTPGVYKHKFSAGDIASGIYFYKLTAGSYSETKKFVLMK